MPHDNPPTAAGLTVADVARKLRIGEDKVRAFINRGELVAVNTAANLCARPRWVISPQDLADFERRRRGGPAPSAKAKQPRRKKKAAGVDYFPDN
jgi:hypothetical protein